VKLRLFDHDITLEEIAPNVFYTDAICDAAHDAVDLCEEAEAKGAEVNLTERPDGKYRVEMRVVNLS